MSLENLACANCRMQTSCITRGIQFFALGQNCGRVEEEGSQDGTKEPSGCNSRVHSGPSATIALIGHRSTSTAPTPCPEARSAKSDQLREASSVKANLVAS
eukprot:gnl/TRDRNA2_/TRDRNA2_159805_c1_seq1.p2 gnl/TRDRNA2_/TRDRNA2_159805_c1~~gnl/TRDRNA2_/TRDRNA2_159805_c1_seq1.p2  ORF type:complete len:101 (-),score=4.78 gnl/TRDRNA2_/TRDRNA2_159805_c1_seq1:275-577(-)